MDLQSRTNALVEEQRLPLEEGLLIALPVERRTIQPATSAHTSTVWKIALQGGRRGYFKAQGSSAPGLAAAYGHHPDEVFLNDCAAWRLARGLGWPFSELATPCVVRLIEGEVGSLIAHRSKTDNWIEIEELFDRHPDECKAAALFDALIGQQDRHDGNYRYDDSAGRIALIDHGFAFPGGTDLAEWPCNNSFFVKERWRRIEQDLHESEEALLRFLLHSPDCLGVAEVLNPPRLDRLRARAKFMLTADRLTDLGQW